MRPAHGALLSTTWLAASLAIAAPMTSEEVAKLCGEAEGVAHCGRLVETAQMKRLPGLAVRDGNTLRITLLPSGNATFTDVETAAGGTTFALWDHVNEINATVLLTTRDDDSAFVLLQRNTGRQTTLPAEPIVSPDRQRIATADFCSERCENKLAVWRVTRDGVRRELEWRPAEPWTDAAVRWKDADTLVVDYTAASSSESRTLTRRIGDAGWLAR
ncbi:MAG TPA: hypothetical protein VNE58_08445 [Casimicrobiaceae bacterium]|nr:hypothetical protein [Casimicrobiaceae bacterium]